MAIKLMCAAVSLISATGFSRLHSWVDLQAEHLPEQARGSSMKRLEQVVSAWLSVSQGQRDKDYPEIVAQLPTQEFAEQNSLQKTDLLPGTVALCKILPQKYSIQQVAEYSFCSKTEAHSALIRSEFKPLAQMTAEEREQILQGHYVTTVMRLDHLDRSELGEGAFFASKKL